MAPGDKSNSLWGLGWGWTATSTPGWPVASSRDQPLQTLCGQLTPWGHSPGHPAVVREMSDSMSKRWLFLSRSLVLLPPAESPVVLAGHPCSEPGRAARCSSAPSPGPEACAQPRPPRRARRT